MRTWKQAGHDLPCGGCRSGIKAKAPMLEIRTDSGARLVRCAPCAKRMFDEDPPAEFPEDVQRGPVPSLLVDTVRQPDVITQEQLARRNQYIAYRQRRGQR